MVGGLETTKWSSRLCTTLRGTTFPCVFQIADHATVDSCVRMLLRWQGSYDAPRVDAAAARLSESVRDATLLPDTSDWTYDAVLQPLQVGHRLRRAVRPPRSVAMHCSAVVLAMMCTFVLHHNHVAAAHQHAMS